VAGDRRRVRSARSGHAADGALRSELEQATRALEAADVSVYEAERNLQFSQRRLLATRRDLDGSRRALAGQAAALYRSGGLVMADALLLYETIDARQIDDIMNGRTPGPPVGWSPGGLAHETPKPITLGGPQPQT